MTTVELLPASEALLIDLLDGVAVTDANIPEVRVDARGLSGARYWWHGQRRRAFEGRRPAAQFDELCAARLLRKLRSERTGTYYSFTPDAFRRRDAALARLAQPRDVPSRVRPTAPPPELEGAASRLDALRGSVEDAITAMEALLSASRIVERFPDDSDDSVVVITADPWAWGDLDSDGQLALGVARRKVERWMDAARTTLATVGPEHLEEFEEAAALLGSYVVRGSRTNGPPAPDIAGARCEALEAFREQLRLIETVPAAFEPSETLVVPDTNALLHDPDIEHWAIGDEPCVVVIVPQVQAELDAKKVNGNERVRDKASSLIRRFKEYARRGDCLEGVTLAGARRFRVMPIQPSPPGMPGWLDPSHADDQILAAALYLASAHLTSPVVLVTRDQGLQNKARVAQVPAVDVADL